MVRECDSYQGGEEGIRNVCQFISPSIQLRKVGFGSKL